MTTTELVRTFLDLTDKEKESVIRRLRAGGTSGEDIDGLVWLSIMSSDKTTEAMFRSLATVNETPEQVLNSL